MKQHHLIKAIYIIIIIFSLCSCKHTEEPDNYGITVDFFMHPEGNGNYDSWRFIYDKEKEHCDCLHKRKYKIRREKHIVS